MITALSMSNCITESSKALFLIRLCMWVMNAATDVLSRFSLVNLGASVVPNFIIRAIAVCSVLNVLVHLLPGKAANPCPSLACHAGVVDEVEG